MPSSALRRSPSLVLYWENGELICEDYLRRERFAVSPETVALLDRFAKPRTPALNERAAARLLERQGLLRRGQSAADKALSGWHWGAAARHFLFSTKAAHRHLPLARRGAYARRLVMTSRQPSFFKEYPGRPQVALDRDGFASPIAPILASVRDVRRFSPKPVPKAWLSEILRLSCGQHGSIREAPWGDLPLKTHHSAGSRYPLEVYPVIASVDGIKAGLYHYNSRRHRLELLRKGNFTRDVRRIAGSQAWVKNAAAYLLVTGVFERTSFKYRHDSFLRSVFIDAGHVSQSVYLSAKALGLGACATHALRHDLAERFLGIDGVRESFLFLIMFGRPQALSDSDLIRPYAKAKGGLTRRR